MQRHSIRRGLQFLPNAIFTFAISAGSMLVGLLNGIVGSDTATVLSYQPPDKQPLNGQKLKRQ